MYFEIVSKAVYTSNWLIRQASRPINSNLSMPARERMSPSAASSSSRNSILPMPASMGTSDRVETRGSGSLQPPGQPVP
jgi:hypothetical protein